MHTSIFLFVCFQKVGPFITARSPPSFHGEITLSERPESSILVASWDENAFIDNNNMGPMKLEYAIGKCPLILH